MQRYITANVSVRYHSVTHKNSLTQSHSLLRLKTFMPVCLLPLTGMSDMYKGNFGFHEA